MGFYSTRKGDFLSMSRQTAERPAPNSPDIIEAK
jgi:hypothetical protein